jgi:N-acetylglucosaminyldiphosphoundecaprenol N-acetyl-beta-D-mannosaminyltransferase
MKSVPYWFLGLPFDCVSEAEATSRLLDVIRKRGKLTFATPNVNFVTMASQDPAFAQAILKTDLSLVDGMPLVWLGRACGIPFPERVAGSSLFDRLRNTESPVKVRVFFFGGEDGVAQAACDRLARDGGALEPAGGLSPGFKSVEAMSDEHTISAINAARPDFLVVSLGAKKGHEWIARNRDRLQAPVVSHLGAVVNFVAGRLKRAPRAVQRSGLEWLWRTATEPRLATRYAADAARLARDMPGIVAPATWTHRVGSRNQRGPLELLEDRYADRSVLRLLNAFHSSDVPMFMSTIGGNSQTSGAGSVIDVSQLHSIDCHGIGAIYAARWRTAKTNVSVIGRSGTRIHDLFRQQRAETLVDWISNP